jgi:hypothetical protein
MALAKRSECGLVMEHLSSSNQALFGFASPLNNILILPTVALGAPAFHLRSRISSSGPPPLRLVFVCPCPPGAVKSYERVSVIK